MLTLNGLEVIIEDVDGYGCDAYLTEAYYLEAGVALNDDELTQLEEENPGIAEEWAEEHCSIFDNYFKEVD